MAQVVVIAVVLVKLNATLCYYYGQDSTKNLIGLRRVAAHQQ
jgi:hypothetical protein